MKKNILLFIIVLTFTSLSFAQTRSADVANPALFEPINATAKIADCRGTSVLKCGRDAMVALELVGFGGEDNFTDREETFNYRSGVSVYLFSILGTKPSFTNEWRTRVAFTKTRNGFRFVQAGTQYRCMINGKRGQWTKEPCEENEQRRPVDYDFDIPTAEAEVRSVEDFSFISVTGRGAAVLSQPCRESLERCGAKMFEALYKPEAFGSASHKKNEVFQIGGRGETKGIFLATAFGYEDDSVLGERVRIEFKRVGQSWHAQNGSRQYLCARGEGAGQWSKNLCP